MDDKRIQEYIARIKREAENKRGEKVSPEAGAAKAGEAPKKSERKSKRRSERPVYEDKGRRTANSRRYLTEKGEWETVISGMRQHYYNAAEGRYRSIDNRLELKGREGDEEDFIGYENRYNSYKARFAREIGGNLMRIEKDGYQVYIRAVDGISESRRVRRVMAEARNVQTKRLGWTEGHENLESAVKYAGVYEGVDLEYEVKSDRIKENIRIRKRIDSYEFVYVITAKGLVLIADNKDRTIKYYKKADTARDVAVFSMPAPYMYDASGKASEDVQYKVEQIDEGEYVLYVAPDAEWINSEDRIFPVTVDPTVIVGKSDGMYYKLVKYIAGLNDKDSLFFLGNRAVGYQNTLRLGYDYSGTTPSWGRGETLLFIGFPDINKMGDGVIKSAGLRVGMVLDSEDNEEHHFFTVRGIKEDKAWWESVGNECSELPNNISSEIFANLKPIINDDGTGYFDIDITSVLRAGYTGIVMQGSKQIAWGKNYVYVWYDGANCLLTLTYAKNHGYGGQTISQSCNRAGNGSIGLFAGNLIFEHKDVSLDGAQLPLNITHIYNSYNYNEEFDSAYKVGAGWKLNFMQTLEKIDPFAGKFDLSENDCYEYIDGKGQSYILSTRYYKNYSITVGKYIKKYKLYCNYTESADPDNGSEEPLKEVSNETYVLSMEYRENVAYNVLTDEAGNKLWFDISSGRLVYVTGAKNSHSLYINYESVSKIKVVDVYSNAAKRTIELNFSGGRLSTITYAGETICSYEYATVAGNTRLRKIIYGGSGTENYSDYEYSTSYGNLYKITDPAGYILEYKQDFDKVPIMTGYFVKSKTESISYNPDCNSGLLESADMVMADDITITYNGNLPKGDTRYRGFVIDNLSIVRNGDGVETYYGFNADGALQFVFDDRDNMQFNYLDITVEDLDDAVKEGEPSYYKTIIKQVAATVIGDNPLCAGEVGSDQFGNGAFFDEIRTIELDTLNDLESGWYVLVACLSGRLVAGAEFENLPEARNKEIAYTVIKAKITSRNDSGVVETVEKYVPFDSLVSGEDKRQLAVLPFYVDKSKVQSVALEAETFGNLYPVVIDTWYLYNAAKASESVANDKDLLTVNRYVKGEHPVKIESDIKGVSVGAVSGVFNCTGEKTCMTIGEYVMTKIDYYDKAHSLIWHEDNNGLISKYKYGITNDKAYVTAEEVSDGTDIMSRAYTYAASGTLIENVMTEMQDESGIQLRAEYNDYAQVSSMIMPATGQRLEYTYNGTEGLLTEIKAISNAGQHVAETSNKLYYNKGYLTRMEHDGCIYDYIYDGFGRVTAVSVGGNDIVRAAYMDGGNNIDGVSGAAKKVVTAKIANEKSVYSTVCGQAICGRATCGTSSANTVIDEESVVTASYYDKYGQLIKVRQANSADTGFKFTDDYDCITVTDTSENGIRIVTYATSGTEYRYYYDLITDRVLAAEQWRGSNISNTFTFEYDKFGRGCKNSFSLSNEDSIEYAYEYKPETDEVSKVTITDMC